jgi:hypothetical protein
MSVLMTKDKKEIVITCDCKCGQTFSISIDDTMEEDGYYAFLCFMKNNMDTEYDLNPWRAFKIKMKKLWYVIRGKDYFYSDTVMTREEFEVFKEYINQF